MRRKIRFITLAGMLAVLPAQAANDRLLFDNPDYEVTTTPDFFCDQPVPVTVHSATPGMFEAGSTTLQRIVDASRAVLGFECPQLNAIRLKGRLTGLDKPVYQGEAERRSGWTLETNQSIHSEAVDDYTSSQGQRDQAGSGEPANGFTVVGLAPGMSVDAARAAVTDQFGVEPDFDIDSGTLSMSAAGCPGDYDWANLSPPPEPGWKCLEAWFTDQRVSRLYLVDLIQVVEATDAQTIRQQLIERFGEPVAQDSSERDSGWWTSGNGVNKLAWGEVVETSVTGDGQGGDVHALQAKVVSLEDATIVAVTLYAPGVQPRSASGADPDTPEGGLKL